MKVIDKTATHGTNHFYETDNGDIYKAYIQHDQSFVIYHNGEYMGKVPPEKFAIVDAVIRSGGDLTALNLKQNQSQISKDGKLTFAFTYKKETGGIKVYVIHNEEHTESQMWPILKYTSNTERDEKTKKALKLIKEACEEYDATGTFQAYKRCTSRYCYHEPNTEPKLIKFDATIEEKNRLKIKQLTEEVEYLSCKIEALTEENTSLKRKNYEQESLLDLYRYDKADEDTTCEHCGGKLERLWSEKTNSLFVGCPQCRKTAKSYTLRYKKLYEEGWLPDRWME